MQNSRDNDDRQAKVGTATKIFYIATNLMYSNPRALFADAEPQPEPFDLLTPKTLPKYYQNGKKLETTIHELI